uniref:GPN-loop GTPase 2 n=1 Tax=Xenopus tropicalis TaxID=8364 RepID=A0A6I8PUS6_XENTR
MMWPYTDRFFTYKRPIPERSDAIVKLSYSWWCTNDRRPLNEPTLSSPKSIGQDDDTCEEWERHEALHEDVTTQDRIKERLYEEEIELKWEKGGSGLVFYTDAQVWQEQEGDFDEQTADDWDVDMSGYYEEDGGDKDARDYLKMRLETRRRDGLATADVGYSVGGFEKHTKLCAVHLVDSHYCTDPAKFISVLCTSLSTMLHVELPHINVLSKMDLIEQYGRLAFNLDYYTEVMDLSYLVEQLTSDPFFRRHKRLHEKLAEVIQDYGLVTFMPLSIKDEKSLRLVLSAVDKASGFCFGETKQSLGNLMSVAVGADFQFTSTLAFQEKYVEKDKRTVEEEALDL